MSRASLVVGRAWLGLGRYWGVVVAIMIAIGAILGGPSAAFYAAMTVLVVVWSLVAAPSWCSAVNPRCGGEIEYCRNNSSGLLLGCWIRQHKYQRFTQPWWGTGPPPGPPSCAPGGIGTPNLLIRSNHGL